MHAAVQELRPQQITPYAWFWGKVAKMTQMGHDIQANVMRRFVSTCSCQVATASLLRPGGPEGHGGTPSYWSGMGRGEGVHVGVGTSAEAWQRACACRESCSRPGCRSGSPRRAASTLHTGEAVRIGMSGCVQMWCGHANYLHLHLHGDDTTVLQCTCCCSTRRSTGYLNGNGTDGEFRTAMRMLQLYAGM